jgi:TatA/E family protein of Tat protein translocase
MGIESPTHLVFLAVIALIVLGPRRLPELARAVGKGMREFREAMDAGASGYGAEPPASQAASGGLPAAPNGAADVHGAAHADPPGD